MSAVTHLLIHRSTHLRKQRVNSGRGAFKETPTPLATGVRCRFNTANQKEKDYGAQCKAVVTHSIYLEPSMVTKVNDDFTGTSKEWAGRTFRVTVPELRPSVPNTYLKVLCEEVQGG